MTGILCVQFRAALEEREFVNKRNEAASLVEETAQMVVRLDNCHAHLKELQISFRHTQSR